MQPAAINTEMPEKTISQPSGNVWLHAIWLVAFLPFIHTLATWDYDGRMSGNWFALRHFSIPVIFGEIFILLIALRNGLGVSRILTQFPIGAKLLLLVWLVFAMASTMMTSDALGSSTLTLSRFFLHGLFFAALVHLAVKAPGTAVSGWITAISFGLFAYLAAIIIFVLSLPDPDNFPWMLRFPSATNIRQIANAMCIMTIAPIALMLFGPARHKWLHLGIIFATTMFIAWTGSRGALASIFIASVIAMILVGSFGSIRNLVSIAAAYFSAMLASIALPVPSPSFGLIRFVSKIETPGNLTSGRIEMWKSTITEIANHPFLGHGAGRYNETMRELYDIDFNHPHNFILQFAYDWGLVGGGAALALVIWLGLSILRKAKANFLLGFSATAGFGVFIIMSMIDGAFFHPLTIILPIALIAPIMRKATMDEDEPHSDESKIAA